MSIKLVRRGKSPNWYIRGTVRGIAVDASTGTDRREVAEAIRAKREVELLDSSVFGRQATATFLEAAVSYMKAGGEARYMERIDEHFGTTPLNAVDQAAIDRAAAKLYPNAAPSTRNRQLYTPVSAVLKHAARRGLCAERRVERPAQPKGRDRYLKPGEAEVLISACAAHLRPLVIFMLYEGARVGEALYLDWREVDLGRAHVIFRDTKNGDHRGVPLHPRVVAELANLPHREGPVFRRPDGLAYAHRSGGGGQIKTGFAAACRRAGITDFRPHDLRHTWATWHYAANRDLGGLMRLAGWRSERMALRYAHVNVDDLARSIEALPWGKSGERKIKRRKKSTVKGA
jgi:integrase